MSRHTVCALRPLIPLSLPVRSVRSTRDVGASFCSESWGRGEHLECIMRQSGLMRSGYSSISRVILLGYMSLSFEDLIIKFICWYTCCVNRRPRKVRASLPISEPLTVGHKGVCWSFKLGVDSYLEPSTRR